MYRQLCFFFSLFVFAPWLAGWSRYFELMQNREKKKKTKKWPYQQFFKHLTK
jgi:hypothetical protein